MTKILLLTGLLLLVWWGWRKACAARASRKRAVSPLQSPRSPQVEPMVRCAQCGVNQPLSESLLSDGRYYCSAAHLRASRSSNT
ncbi:MAG TPA: PP0621 family protein [Accumulibacter sp.]|nr:PP0621 family protein [Accumulibacter sp.]HQC79879.1 PP0621 family protein [Accumulibacter sp.]